MTGADDVDQVTGRQPREADLDVAHGRLGDHDALAAATGGAASRRKASRGTGE